MLPPALLLLLRRPPPAPAAIRIPIGARISGGCCCRAMSSGPQGPGRAFVNAFVGSVRRQMDENKQLRDNIKQLTDETSRLTDSESLRRARMRVGQESSAIKTRAAAAAAAATAVAAAAADTSVGRAAKAGIQTTARVVERAAAPIVESKVYRAISSNVSDAIHSNEGCYGGFASPAHREAVRARFRREWTEVRRRRPALAQTIEQEQQARDDEGSAVAANNTATQVTKTAGDNSDAAGAGAGPSARERLRRAAQAIGERVAKSDNLAVSWARYFCEQASERMGGLLEESETARALSRLRELDTGFRADKFMQSAREYMIPEILSAWLAGDRAVLARWCEEVPTATIMAAHNELARENTYNDSRVLELQSVELTSARMLDNGVAALVVACQTQENVVYRDRESRRVLLGAVDRVHLVSYVFVFTLDDTRDDGETHGWRVLDAARHQQSGAIF